MIDIEGIALSDADRALLREPLVGGIILFSRNYADPEQLASLTAEIHALRSPPLLIAVDQEGGRVQRFRNGLVELPALLTLGKNFSSEPEAALAMAADHACMMASELRALGIDFSFAPVLDVYTVHSAVIGDRALHADPSAVAKLARTYITALNACGMAAVGKHFPGHGCVAADSHLELPVDEREFDEIERHDLLPFRALIDAGIAGVMMAHVRYPKIDELAAGYSSHWIRQILRREMRFEGVVFSDDLSMLGAVVEGSYADRARLALDAGCDVLLVCNQRSAVLEIVAALAGEQFPETQARIIRMHARGPSVALPDLQASARWQAVNDQFCSAIPCPELDLGDDNLLG